MQTFIDYAAYILPWFLVLSFSLRAISEVLIKAGDALNNQRVTVFGQKLVPYIELMAKITGYFGVGKPKALDK